MNETPFLPRLRLPSVNRTRGTQEMQHASVTQHWQKLEKSGEASQRMWHLQTELGRQEEFQDEGTEKARRRHRDIRGEGLVDSTHAPGGKEVAL